MIMKATENETKNRVTQNVNTVTNGPKTFGRINRLAVLTRGFFLQETISNNFLMQYNTKRHNDQKFSHGTRSTRKEIAHLFQSCAHIT